ncbi:MAG: alpha/beta hydrolase [Dehalococcoidales bacterium]|nr:alpha/beta hydrolase [Dehalococcoidales bacterium]
MNLRTYGQRPFHIAVLHGGPGAPGEMAPVARELASSGGVMEPFQTANTINGQLLELHTVLQEHSDPPIVLIGWSWGAWLGFLFSATYPALVKKLILISSGPFEEKCAAGIMATRLSRFNDAERAETAALTKALDDPAHVDKDALMRRLGQLMERVDSFDPLPDDEAPLPCRYDIYQNIWQEASEMRRSGRLLELGRNIRCPVVAIHGDYDPHPAEGIKEPLSRMVKDFRFILLEKCGHHPWREKAARDNFYKILRLQVASSP